MNEFTCAEKAVDCAAVSCQRSYRCLLRSLEFEANDESLAVLSQESTFREKLRALKELQPHRGSRLVTVLLQDRSGDAFALPSDYWD